MALAHLEDRPTPRIPTDIVPSSVPAQAKPSQVLTSALAQTDGLAKVAHPGLTERAKRTVSDILGAAGITINGSNPWDIQVRDPSFYVRVMRDPDMQLGVTYMDGLWDCANIDQLTTRLMQSKARVALLKPEVLARTPGLIAEGSAHYAYRYARDAITNRQTRDRSTTVAKEHYDVGNTLYMHQLGPTMSYTSGVYADGYSLEDAQNAKHDLLCRKMGLSPGDRVLDIGCGFGGFARFAAEHYGAEVVGITISTEQLKAARALSRDTPGVSFLYSDYRDIANRFPRDHFDHVVSIEMIEAVGHKNLHAYFKAAQACLKSGGTFALQAICQNYDKVNSNAWFSEYIFQDGVAPSRNQVDTAAADFFGKPEDVHRITDSYDKTLLAWHDNFTASWPALEGDYSGRFKRMWDYYLLSVAGGFRAGIMNVDQVVYRKDGPSAIASAVRSLPRRADLDAWRATPAQQAALATRVTDLEAHTKQVKRAAAPKRVDNKPLELDARICVIGAGPSGLSVAHELRNKGYTNVVVLEASDAVGGKSHTVDIAGRKHDLGATMGVPRKYDEIFKLAEANGVETVPFPKQVHFDLQTGAPRAKPTFSYKLAMAAGFLTYLATNASLTRAHGKSLEVPPDELADSFDLFAARHGFTTFADQSDSWRTNYGYGFSAETPAVYPLRMLTNEAMLGVTSGLKMWANGTTPIWQGVARDLDVRLNTRVTAVNRNGGQVTVTTTAGEMTFDRLVVACDPTLATSFLDATPEEKSVFSNIQHMPYSTFAVRVKGISDGEPMVGYIRKNATRERIGHPLAWIKRYGDDDVCVFHLFAPAEMSDDDVMAKIREDMTKLGATDCQLVEAKRWKFFPHVNSDAMRLEKFFERAKNLQGEKHTFFANEALSMSTMADVNAYAKTIAERVASSG